MAERLAAHATCGPHDRLEALFANGLATLVTEPVGLLFELFENAVDVGRNLLQLPGSHGHLHLQDGISSVVAGALSELHLDSGRAHRLGQLAQLGREFLTVRPQERWQLVSFQGQCSMVRLAVSRPVPLQSERADFVRP